ncbi:MAG TPA: flagellar basal body P-ring formation chaperone FlgA [Parvularculaceae bacterium]|nr:flagellar basal body P-ring formation chaperone FlgA [Parvularculaceae bacterium]
MKTRFSGLIAAAILATGYSPAAGEELIAARNIRAGEVLLASDIVTPDSETGLRQAASLIGLEAARSIYRGQPINAGDLRSPTLVDRNAMVRMEFSKGAMAIATQGRALDQGGLGDRIRVMNIASKRIVSAIVISNNTVRSE